MPLLPDSDPATYRVQVGDTTRLIAQHLGITTDQLVAANPHKDAHIQQGEAVFDELVEGEVLHVPLTHKTSATVSHDVPAVRHEGVAVRHPHDEAHPAVPAYGSPPWAGR